MTGILIDYDSYGHVPSDIGTHQKFLPPEQFSMQSKLDEIARWTISNKMKLNSSKSNYMIFSRSQEEFATRLAINGQTIEQKEACKVLGVWISQDAGDWERNTKEICKSAYSRISMLTKLKYVGVKIQDLLEIYTLFVRSRAEYCSVAFHSSLTQEQSRKIENIQRTSLKIILQENYTDYASACDIVGLPPLFSRRETRVLSFARRSLKTDEMAKLFPLTPDLPDIELRKREKLVVNFAHGEKYCKSTIPYCQRKLNEFSQGAKESDQMNDRQWKEWMAGLEGRLRSRREQRAAEGVAEERVAGEGGAGVRAALVGGAGEGGQREE